MTVVTINIDDNNLLLRLREWLKTNAPTTEMQEQTDEINWTDAKLDAQTNTLVKDSIARRKTGDTSHLSPETLQEIFYDL